VLLTFDVELPLGLSHAVGVGRVVSHAAEVLPVVRGLEHSRQILQYGVQILLVDVDDARHAQLVSVDGLVVQEPRDVSHRSTVPHYARRLEYVVDLVDVDGVGAATQVQFWHLRGLCNTTFSSDTSNTRRHLLATMSWAVPVDSIASVSIPKLHLTSPLFFSVAWFRVKPQCPAPRPDP
jgi:hypothetical protein